MLVKWGSGMELRPYSPISSSQHSRASRCDVATSTKVPLLHSPWISEVKLRKRYNFPRLSTPLKLIMMLPWVIEIAFTRKAKINDRFGVWVHLSEWEKACNCRRAWAHKWNRMSSHCACAAFSHVKDTRSATWKKAWCFWEVTGEVAYVGSRD